MSSIYNPNGTLPTPVIANNGRFAILSSTNATPIVLAFSAPPGFQDQDTIEVLGHATNTNANGLWTASKVDSTHYALNGSIGNGVGAATGYCIDYTVNPILSLPGDGDLASATNLNTPTEGIANTIPWGYRNAGKYRMIDTYEATFVDDTFGGATVNYSVSSSTYSAITGLTDILSFSAPAPVFGGANDFFDITWDASLNPGGVSSNFIALGIGISIGGGAYGIISGSASQFGTADNWTPVHLNTYYQLVLGPTLFFTFNFCVMAALISGSTTSLIFQGSRRLIVRHYRGN